MVVHGGHAEGFTRLHDAGDHEGFAVTDTGGDGGGVDEDFHGEGAAFAVGGGEKLLGDDSSEGFGDHDADLVALVEGEDVEDAVEGAGGVAGVEGPEDEVPGFGGGDGELDRFEVPHFSHDDDVGVFAEGGAEGAGEGLGMEADFAVSDVAALGGVHEFDGVFEGEDVVVAVFIDMVNHGGHGGGFSGADGAGDEDEAVLVAAKGFEDLLGELEVVHGADGGVDDAEDEGEAEALADDGGTEAAVLVLIGVVGVSFGTEGFFAAFVEEGVDENFHLFGGELGGFFPDGLEFAKASPGRLASCGEVDVGGVVFYA